MVVVVGGVGDYGGCFGCWWSWWWLSFSGWLDLGYSVLGWVLGLGNDEKERTERVVLYLFKKFILFLS